MVELQEIIRYINLVRVCVCACVRVVVCVGSEVRLVALTLYGKSLDELIYGLI